MPHRMTLFKHQLLQTSAILSDLARRENKGMRSVLMTCCVGTETRY